MRIHIGLLGAAIASFLSLPASGAGSGERLLTVGTGTGICRAIDGVDTNFVYGALGVRNISSKNQLLTCSLQLMRPVDYYLTRPSGYQLTLYFGNSAPTAQTVTCTALVAYAGQTAATRSQATKSVVVAANGSGRIDYYRDDLYMADPFSPLSLSCSLPPRVIFGRFDEVQPTFSPTDDSI